MTAIASKQPSFGVLSTIFSRIGGELRGFFHNLALSIEVARMVNGRNEVPAEARRLLGIAPAND